MYKDILKQVGKGIGNVNNSSKYALNRNLNVSHVEMTSGDIGPDIMFVRSFVLSSKVVILSLQVSPGTAGIHLPRPSAYLTNQVEDIKTDIADFNNINGYNVLSLGLKSSDTGGFTNISSFVVSPYTVPSNSYFTIGTSAYYTFTTNFLWDVGLTVPGSAAPTGTFWETRFYLVTALSGVITLQASSWYTKYARESLPLPTTDVQSIQFDIGAIYLPAGSVAFILWGAQAGGAKSRLKVLSTFSVISEGPAGV